MSFRRKILFALVVVVFAFIFQAIIATEEKPVEIPAEIAPVVAEAELPGKVVSKQQRTITAYTSEISQTDGSPCISADGTNICEAWQEGKNVCAANFVPFGTRLSVEGLGICIVMDRMNIKHGEYVDWYFGYDTEAAINFGKQQREVIILENAIWTNAN